MVGRGRPDPQGEWQLALALRTELEGPTVRVEAVTAADLSEAVSESWLEGYLRSGIHTGRPEDLTVRVRPTVEGGDVELGAYLLETVDAGGRRHERAFSLHSLGHVADRAAQELREAGVLSEGALYYYDLEPRRRPVSNGDAPPRSEPAPSGLAAPLFKMEARRRPLTLMPVRLGELMDRTVRTAGAPPAHPGGFHPVFYTEAAAARAEAFSRKGESAHPPEESGGVLVGPLCACPDTGELFTVVSEVFEATDAQRSEFSLAYSGRTWSRIQRIVRALRSQPSTASYRILGQCHGHNFLPADGAPPCETCHRLEECSRTSVFVSSHDLTWSRAVFAGQPWKLCQIHGLNARGERVEGLFGLRDARLLRRDYHVIPDFDPKEWAAPRPARASH